MDAGVDVFLDQPLTQKNSVFEVVSVPRHECDHHIPPQGQFALIGARSVCNDHSFGHTLTHLHHGALVHTGSVVGTHELEEVVDIDPLLRIRLHPFAVFRGFSVFCDNDLPSGDRGHFAGTFTQNHGVGITGYLGFHACSDNRSFGNQQGDALPLHVRTHQGPVRVVVFQEWNQGSRDRNQLLRGNVHVVNLVRFNFQELSTISHRNSRGGEFSMAIHSGVRLGNDEVFLLICGEEIELSLHATILYLAVGRLDEAELIDFSKCRKTRDQSDVWTFRSFNRTNPTVVGRMHVTDFKARTLPAQSPWSKGR